MSPEPGGRCWRCGVAREGTACPRCGTAGPAPAPARKGPVTGLTAVVSGVRFLDRHPRLWRWILIPLVLNAVVFALLVWGTFTGVRTLVPEFTEPWPVWVDWARVALGWVLPFLLGLVSLLAAFFVTLLVASVVNAPFYDLLSEQVEAAELDRVDPGRPWSRFAGDLVRSIATAAILAVGQAAVMAVLFVLSFTAVGAPVFLVAGFYFAGFALADVTLGRKLYGARERIRWCRTHAPLLIGLGAPIVTVPLLAPFAVIGATLAFLRDTEKG